MKRILAFLVAILSVLSLSAEVTLYLNTGGDALWNQGGAKFAIYYYNSTDDNGWSDLMTVESGNIFKGQIPEDYAYVIFARLNSSATAGDWNKVWNKTADLSLGADNLYTITGWGVETDEGEWSTYTPVTEPTITDIEISGRKMAGNELTFTAKCAGFSGEPTVVYQVNGEEQPGNTFTPPSASVYTVRAEATYGDDEYAENEIDVLVQEKPEDIVVKLLASSTSWSEVAVYAYDDLGVLTPSWPGVKLEASEGWYSYTISNAGDNLNIIFNNNNNGEQTADTPVSESTCYELSGTNLNERDCTLPATKIYAKNNWSEGEWAWLEMTKEEESTIYNLENVVFGGNGVNINNQEAEEGQLWFDLKAMQYASEADSIQAKDTVNFAFNLADSTLVATLIGRPVEPVVVYDTTMFVAGNFTEWEKGMQKLPYTVEFPIDSTLQFKQVRRILKLEDGVVIDTTLTWYGNTIDGDYMTEENPSRKLEGDYNVYIMTDPEGEYTFSYNADNEHFEVGWPGQPAPVAKVYAKNNWDGGEEWTWKELTKDPESTIYTLDKVVFGGTGVNINDRESDLDALWYDLKAMHYIGGTDSIKAKDTINLVFNKADSILVAEIVARPVEPEVKIYAKNNWDGGDWAWLEMTKEEESQVYNLENVVFGGTGVNINNKEAEEGQLWFDLKAMQYASEADSIQAKDTVNFAFNLADSTLVATLVGRPEEPEPSKAITVKLKASSIPDTWGDQLALYAWIGSNYPCGQWPGTVLTEEDGWYSYTFDESITEIGIVWNDNKTNNKQTSSIKGITTSVCHEINGGSGKAHTVAIVDCPEPSTDPEILSLTPAPATSEVGETVTFTVVTNNFSADPTVVYSVKAEEGEYQTLADNTYTSDAAGIYTVKAVATNEAEVAEKTAQFTVNPATATTDVQIKLPSDWTEPAIYSWGGSHSGVEAMTQGEAEGELTWWSGIVYSDFTGFLFKNVADKTTWDIQTTNVTEIPTEHTCYALTGAQEEGKYVVAVTTCPGGPEPEVKIYAKNNWSEGEWTWMEMTKEEESTVYNLNNVVFGGNGVNINNQEADEGAIWYDLQAMQYASEADSIQAKDTVNFAFNLADSTLVATLIGRPEPGPEPETGVTVNVEVPTGTPACAFYGALSDNAFVDMTMVDETHYTITFSDKTAEQVGWGYKFCWENGNWNTQAKPDSTYKVTDGSTIVVTGWQTEPGTSYMYTEYTEWNIKYAPNWEWESLTQQAGSNDWTANITWGGTGANIGSCAECPIKQDWYPADQIEGGDLEAGTAAIFTLTVIDDETVALKVEAATSADEAEAEAADAIYKTIENGQIIIVTPNGKFNLLGAPVK